MKLQLTNLCKNFGGHSVLDKVTLTLNDVNTLVVIGPSGGGKSTLLRIIAGLEYPDEGAVTIDGEPLKFDEVSLQRYRRTIGTVFQTFNLFPHLDALGNITLPLKKVHGYTSDEVADSARQILRRPAPTCRHRQSRRHQAALAAFRRADIGARSRDDRRSSGLDRRVARRRTRSHSGDARDGFRAAHRRSGRAVGRRPHRRSRPSVTSL